MAYSYSVGPNNVVFWTGQSTDARPVVGQNPSPKTGDWLYEYDSGNIYAYRGGAWALQSAALGQAVALPDTPVLMVGADHALKQFTTMLQMYMDQGLMPYLAVNTQDDAGEYIAASADKLTMAQVKAIQDLGVEIEAHGSQHIQSWNLINTGLKLTYAGAGTLVLFTTSGTFPAITVVGTCTGAAGDNFSIDCTSLTLAQLKAAIEATGAAGTWSCRISPELTGSEPANFIAGCNASESVTFSNSGGKLLATYTTDLPNASPVVFAGTAPDAISANTMYWTVRISATTSQLATTRANALAGTAINYGATNGSGLTMYREGTIVKPMTAHDTVPVNTCLIAVGGGITIQYTGTVYKSAYYNITNTPSLDLYGDGVQVGTFTLGTTQFDTLSELVAAISATPGWSAKLMDNDKVTTYSNQSYVSGNEKSNRLWRVQGVDVIARPANSEFGLSTTYMISRQVQENVDTPAAAGIVIENFAESGQAMYPWLADGVRAGGCKKIRGNPFVRTIINPMMTPFGERPDEFHVVTSVTLNNPLAQMKGWIDALCASPGHYMDLLIHSMQADGSSGYGVVSPVGATPSILESDFYALIKYIRQKVVAGQLIVMLPKRARNYVRQASPPVNLIKNPKFVNPGNALTGFLSSDGTGNGIPGWAIFTPANITACSVAADGTLTATSNASTAVDMLIQEVQLKPGATYEFSCDMELSYTGGNGVYLRLQKRLTSMFKGMQPHTSNTVFGSFKYIQNGRMSLRFTVPKRDDAGWAYVRSSSKGPWDLSNAANAAMKVNLAAKGSIDNIQVTDTAVTPSAMTTDGSTVTVTSPNSFKVGRNVTVAGTTPAGFNGTYAVTGIIRDGSGRQTGFTYANATAGPITVIGTVVKDKATVHADDIATALNNAIQNNSAYSTLQEYWNVFTAEDGYLVGRLPWRYGDNTANISMDAATTNGGATAIVMNSSQTVTFSSSSGLLGTYASDPGPTGTPVVFTAATTLPTGLAANTVYYLIRVTSTTSRFATSLANALAGTSIAFTDAGTGAQVMYSGGNGTVRGINFQQQLPSSEDFTWRALITFDMTGTVKLRNPMIREDMST